MKNIYIESETVELKKSTSELKEALVSVSAILNKHGSGEIYFGIKNDGTVAGQNVADTTLRKISKAISDHITPKIFPIINSEDIDGKACVKVLFDGASAPYYAYGRAYIRVSDEDRQISPAELERIIVAKNKNNLHWDDEASQRVTLDDINEESLRFFVERANISGRLESKFTDKISILSKLDLITNDGTPSNTAAALFCEDNKIQLQMAIFATDTKVTFNDIKLETGTVFQLLDKAELYLRNNLHWRVKFGKLEREEIPEIPVEALREALVNSFCHRDYRNPKGNEVAIFKDRVEIYNPGTFPNDIEPEAFILGNERSILRNPLLAEMLYLCKEIERWGSGLERIKTLCDTTGTKVEFKRIKTGFLIVFTRNKGDFIIKSDVGFCEQVTEQVTEQVKSLLECLKDKSLGASDIMVQLGLRHRPTFVYDYLKPAIEDGLVEMTEPDSPKSPTQKYRLVERELSRYKEDLLDPDEQVTEQVTEQVKSLLECLKDKSLGASDIMVQLGLRHRPTFIYDYLKPAIDEGLVEMTEPDSPKSPTQKYRLVKS